jgi:ABC-type phosphonate transport system ATPase subunit
MRDRAAALELTNLSRSYGDRVAVDNLSFSVLPGEVVAGGGWSGRGQQAGDEAGGAGGAEDADGRSGHGELL